MDIKETDFYKFVEKFFKENNQQFEGLKYINRYKYLPIDSVDRIIALYLIETNSELLKLDFKGITCVEELSEWYDNLDNDFKEWYEEASIVSYNNYERESMSPATALYLMIIEAKKGKDHVLKDEYAKGGYFGAS